MQDFEGESELLEALYARGLQQPVVGADLYAGDGLLMFWSHVPIAPWQTDAWIEQMRRSAGRTRLLAWSRTASPPAKNTSWTWRGGTPARPGARWWPNADLPVWIGVDASVKRDITAIAVVTWDRAAKQVVLVNHRIFQPSAVAPINFEFDVENTIIDMHSRYRVRAVRYDPYQMAASAQRLVKAGVQMEEFPQSVPNLTAASQNFYELIKAQGIVVYRDADIRLAVQRAIALETTRGWRIAKEKTSHKIDIVVALAQAALAAVRKGEMGRMRAGTIDTDGFVHWRDEESHRQRICIETVTEKDDLRQRGLL